MNQDVYDALKSHALGDTPYVFAKHPEHEILIKLLDEIRDRYEDEIAGLEDEIESLQDFPPQEDLEGAYDQGYADGVIAGGQS